MLPCSVSRLSILDGPLCFLYRLFTTYSLSYVLCTLCCHVVSLDCPFLMAPFVFSNVYLLPTVCPMSCVPNVFCVSGSYILNGPLCFLYRLFTTYSLSYVLCTLCCQVLSLDCPFLMAPFVFSTVYLLPTVCPMSYVPYVAMYCL